MKMFRRRRIYRAKAFLKAEEIDGEQGGGKQSIELCMCMNFNIK